MNIIAEGETSVVTLAVNQYTIITIVSSGGSGDTTIEVEISGGRYATLSPITGGVGYSTLDGMFSNLKVTPGTSATVDIAARERR